jgi:hypothetical protein
VKPTCPFRFEDGSFCDIRDHGQGHLLHISQPGKGDVVDFLRVDDDED